MAKKRNGTWAHRSSTHEVDGKVYSYGSDCSDMPAELYDVCLGKGKIEEPKAKAKAPSKKKAEDAVPDKGT